MFSPREAELERGWPGRVDGDRVVQLAAQTLRGVLHRRRRRARARGVPARRGRVPAAGPAPAERSRLLGAGAPRARRSSRFATRGRSSATSRRCRSRTGTAELDLGLAVAAVIGADGAIGGVTLANDWTARDLERAERASGFGPSKSKDFALSLGPVLVTPDELDGGAAVRARVNGEERARLDLGALAYVVAGARRARGAEHGAPAGRAARVQRGPDRRAVARAGRRRRARARGRRRAAEPPSAAAARSEIHPLANGQRAGAALASPPCRHSETHR